MEPGRKDRDDLPRTTPAEPFDSPQWSPVEKTGMTTHTADPTARHGSTPQWSPVEKTGMTFNLGAYFVSTPPQWSPVEKTGMTGGASRAQPSISTTERLT